jgi:hypothetical protein
MSTRTYHLTLRAPSPIGFGTCSILDPKTAEIRFEKTRFWTPDCEKKYPGLVHRLTVTGDELEILEWMKVSEEELWIDVFYVANPTSPPELIIQPLFEVDRVCPDCAFASPPKAKFCAGCGQHFAEHPTLTKLIVPTPPLPKPVEEKLKPKHEPKLKKPSSNEPIAEVPAKVSKTQAPSARMFHPHNGREDFQKKEFAKFSELEQLRLPLTPQLLRAIADRIAGGEESNVVLNDFGIVRET